MSDRMDRQGVRTPADLERKYQYSKQFAEIMGIALDAQKSVEESQTKINGELSLKLGRDENNQIVSMLNASADAITIKGDRLTISSKYFNLAADGTVTARAGKIGGCDIVDDTLQIKNANIVERLTADKINATDLEVDAANVKGTLKADKIDVSEVVTAAYVEALNITVDAALQVKGRLTIGQLPENAATTDDLANYVKPSGVTTIVDGHVNTDYVNALKITALGTVTTGILQSLNWAVDETDTPTAGMLINLNLGVINTPNFKVYANGNVLVDGTLRSKSGRLGNLYIDENGLTCGNIHFDENGLRGSSTSILPDGEGEVTESFEITSSGDSKLFYTVEKKETGEKYWTRYGAGLNSELRGFIILSDNSSVYELYLDKATNTVKFYG